LGICIEPERESRIDTCVECCVRDRDFSQKKVYRCDLCDRWFCEKHFEPRLAFIKDLNAIENNPEISALYHTEVEGKEDGHPDFEYSRRKLTELNIEEKRRSELIEEALNRMNARYKMKSCQGTEGLEEEAVVTRALPEVAKETSKNGIISEGDFHFKKAEVEEPRKKRRFPIGKAIGVVLAIMIIGALLFYSPNIISMIQNYSSSSSYTQITASIYNSTSLQFGGVDYFFEMGFTQQYQGVGYLIVWDSLVESKDYNITAGAIYRDFGIEMKVKELHPDYAVLLVKPTVQNYLAESGFTKLTIAEGQIQTLSFDGNNYTVSYSQAHLYVATPLFQYRDYLLTSVPTTIHSDLGLEIRVSSIAIGHVVVFVKPSY
jgi:hypothetical protein